MSINTILSISETVGIDDQRFIGQILSRNQRIKTSEIMTVVPFKFTMKPHAYLLYSQNRAVLSTLRAADRSNEQYINFPSTGWINYVSYRGDLTSAQISASNWNTPLAGSTNLIFSPTAGISSTAYIVRQGDFCQYGRYTYIATADVQRGISATVNIPVHRNIIVVYATLSCVIGQYGTTVALGGYSYTGVTFPVILQEYPTYTLVPMTNDSFIQWNGNFAAIESVL